MDIFNSTFNRLIEKGFIKAEVPELENMGMLFFQTETFNVVVRNVYASLEIESIKLESIKVREILLDMKQNVWNSYLLLCMHFQADRDTVYTLERDTRALRKYVIYTEFDLNRIPFLDNIEVDNSLSDKEDVIDLQNPYVSNLVDFLNDNEGKDRKLNQEEISNAFMKILDMVE